MIFTTDLDRTLVFSDKRLIDKTSVIPIEQKNDRDIGFLRPNALKIILSLQKKTIFLANTMRNEDQANRISFIKGSLYLAVLGGLHLYRRGVLDLEWERRVKRALAELPRNLSQVIAKPVRTLQGIERISTQTEHLAVFALKEEAIDQGAYLQMKEELKKEGWGLRHQGKKLYLYPLTVHKGSIVKRVQELEGESDVLGFGDSYFDLAMLKECKRAYSLKGSELYHINSGLPIHFSEEEAEKGSEENLYHILLQTQEKKEC